jgi:uncharacterized protein YjiS (DUF1127 family)
MPGPLVGRIHHDGFGFVPERSPSWAVRLTAAVVRFWTGLRERYDARRAREALTALDDRVLRDMGISRIEIDYVVRHGRRPPD